MYQITPSIRKTAWYSNSMSGVGLVGPTDSIFTLRARYCS